MVKKVDKPIRLYVMTIFVVIAYGILPLVSVFPFTGGYLLVGPRFLPFNGSLQVLYDSNGEISMTLLVVTLGLSLLAAGSAIVTFLGVKEGRVATLIFLTLNVAWWFYLVITAMTYNDQASDNLGLGLQLLFPPLWLALVWWNMTRPDIASWLSYQEQLEN